MPNNNPTGKGGFTERPQDINVGGRPKKYLTKLLEEIGAEIEPKSGKSFKELISRRAWVDALNGDQRACNVSLKYLTDIKGVRKIGRGSFGQVIAPTNPYLLHAHSPF